MLYDQSYTAYTIFVYHSPQVGCILFWMGIVNLKDRAYNHLRQKLTDGNIRPGGKISLAGIAKEIGVSHIPVREAVNRLCSEGYVIHTPSVGFFVRKISRKELADLFKVRESLEMLAAGEAVTKITDKEIGQLEGIFKAMRDRFHLVRDQGITDWSGPMIKELTMLDLAFHAIIVKAADNEVLERVLSEQRVFSEIFGRAIKGPPTSMVQRLAKVYRWHYRLLRAIQKRDVAMAQQAAGIHVREAGEYVLACVDWADRQKKSDSLRPWDSTPEELMEYINREYLNNDNSKHGISGPKGGRKKN